MNQTLLIYILLPLAIPMWLLILRRWYWGLIFLFIYIPVSGVPILLTNYNPMAVLFKDFAFIVPLYVSFYAFVRQESEFRGVPKAFYGLMVAHALLIFGQMFNPEVPSILVAAIGAKVWLFYIPLFGASYAYFSSRQNIEIAFRVITLTAWIPAGLGIAQWIMASSMGHRPAMEIFYGPVGYAATQGYAAFHYGPVSLYRLPSTFSFAAQYSTYLWAAAIGAYILLSIERNKHWRRFALVSMAVILVAAFLSGARGAFFFMPLILGISVLLHRGIKGSLKPLLALIACFVLLEFFSGLKLSKLFSDISYLLTYYPTNLAQVGFEAAINKTWIGVGTGMNTIAAQKYAFLGAEQTEKLIKIESYYAKIVIELGILGLITFVAWQALLIFKALECSLRLKSKELRGVAAPLAAFFIVMSISNFKSFRMDFDPLNMYFWIFAGLLFRLNYLLQDRVSRVVKSPSAPLREFSKLPKVAKYF